MKSTVFCLALICAVSLAHAGGDTQSPPGQGGPAGLDEAMKACQSSAGQSSSGKPDPAAFDACMAAKGFKKPDGAPARDGRGAAGGQGQGGAALDEAMKACRGTEKSSNEKPDPAAFERCMAAKGFKKPD
jgi:hypothetical protein